MATAYEEGVNMISVQAGADLSSHSNKFVKLDGNGQAFLGGDGEKILGVLKGKPNAAGIVAPVADDGIVAVIAGDTIDEGGDVASNGSGLAVPAATGDYVAGVAMTSAASGQHVSVNMRARFKKQA